MIVEFRTYRLKPGSVAEAEKRFGEGLVNRTKVSPLGAFWHTEVGPLNRIIHVWPYEDFAHREKIRSQKIEGWPPKIQEFIEEMNSEIFIPAPFSPKLEPRQLGGIYEIRTYTLAAGAIPAIIDRWGTAIDKRMELSPLAFAGHSELGGLNRWRHIWAYKDANHRAEIRAKAQKEGIWPPRGGQPGQTLIQENMLVVPAAFSPLK
ncbi:MAG: NIPSNAP family protein [Thiohalocapsa sp.]